MFKKVKHISFSLALIILIFTLTACDKSDKKVNHDTTESHVHNASDNVVTFESILESGFSVVVGDTNVVIKNFDSSIVSYSKIGGDTIVEKSITDCVRIDYNVDYSIFDFYLYLTPMSADTFEGILEDNNFETSKSFYEDYKIYLPKNEKDCGIYSIYDAGSYRAIAFMNTNIEFSKEHNTEFQNTFFNIVETLIEDVTGYYTSIDTFFDSIVLCGMEFSDSCSLDFWNTDLIRMSINDSAVYLTSNDSTLTSFEFDYLGKIGDSMMSICEVESGVYGLSLMNGVNSYYLWYYANETPKLEDIDIYFSYKN